MKLCQNGRQCCNASLSCLLKTRVLGKESCRGSREWDRAASQRTSVTNLWKLKSR